MNLFNRIVVTLLLLSLIPIVAVSLIAPHEAIELLRDTLDEIEGGDESLSAGQLLLRGGLVVLIDALLVFVLFLQVRRPSAPGVRVRQAEGGDAQIAVSSIVSRLEYHVDCLSGVLGVKLKVAARRRGVEVALDVETVADVYLPTMIEEISAVTRRVVEEEMGLQLKGKPKINLRTVAYPPVAEEPASVEVEEPPFAEVGEPDFPIIEGEVVEDEPSEPESAADVA